ncbi:uncharacterized protein [Panulirus ornatus]|uniref:uncharacterized protein n=1 Tax=Panulirus ornatus TaxID=150431 RepID=UPI003A85036C
MGDERSDTSSLWPRDELEFVNEFTVGPEPSNPPEDSVITKEREEAVSAALSVVVASARQGVVALCASVAHIIRAKMRLQHRVEDLEKKLAALEKSSTTDVSEACHCPYPSQAADSHSLLESPTSQRCGSAPPSFIVGSLKFSRSDNQNSGRCCQICDPRNVVCDNKCGNCQLIHHPERRTSNVTIHDNSSNTYHKTGEKKAPFLRGQSHASTRSLNISRSPPSSSFMRKKYSTISLRRVRRTGLSRHGTSGMWSCSDSHGSSANSLEHRGSASGTSSRSCVVTVAEVYPPPVPSLTPINTESDTVRLLARKLTNVLQGSEAVLEDSVHDASPCGSNVSDTTVPEAAAHEQLCAPYPLAGCECVVCTHLASDPECHLYVLTTNEGSLLPRGSKVLVQGDHIGTVVYLGHHKHPLRYSSVSQHHIQPSAATSINQTVIAEASDSSSKNIINETCEALDVSSLSPLGVTITLWPPDQGELFVPLGDVICQLDDEVDIDSGEYLLGLDVEYVDDDNNVEEFNPSSSSDTRETVCEKFIPSSIVQHLSLPLTKERRARSATPELRRASEESCARSPSISSHNSDSIHGLGELSQLGVENEDENLNTCAGNSVRVPLQETRSTYEASYSFVNVQQFSSSDLGNVVPLGADFQSPCLSAVCKIEDEDGMYGEIDGTESRVSLYDTSDSAISLTFTQKLQGSEESSEPQSLTDLDKDSLHFGDTWDSGCCMGSRERYRSESSEQYSDYENESKHTGALWARNLSEALDSVWKKHKNIKDFCLDSIDITRDIELPRQEVMHSEYSKHLHLLENIEVTSPPSYQFDNSLTEHTEV